MIHIHSLSKSFASKSGNVDALKDINLEIAKGDIFGIIGESGAGKSTLIRCINRIETPTEGAVLINGVNILNLNEKELIKLRRRMGMIFQNFNLLSRKTCAENIAFPLRIARYNQKDIDKRVDELLDLVGLKDKKNSYPSQLSGGQKQRVAIARAIADNAEILLCDEATSALDPTTTKSILKLLRDINATLGITIVLITHQMEVIKEICNKVAVIVDGNIVETGSTYDVVTQPKNAVTKRFFHDNMQDIEIPIVYTENHSITIKINFLDDKAYEPIISKMVKEIGTEVNIIGGHISNIQSRGFGNLIINLKGEPAIVEKSIKYIQEQGLILEVLS